MHLKDAVHEIEDDLSPAGKAAPAAVDNNKPGAQCVPVQELRAGIRCPVCQRGRLDYNGLLNLACPVCGFTAGGSFT